MFYTNPQLLTTSSSKQEPLSLQSNTKQQNKTLRGIYSACQRKTNCKARAPKPQPTPEYTSLFQYLVWSKSLINLSFEGRQRTAFKFAIHI